MKALSGRLLHHVTGCKRQTEEDGGRSVSMAEDGLHTFSSGLLKGQHPNAPTVTLPDIKLSDPGTQVAEIIAHGVFCHFCV